MSRYRVQNPQNLTCPPPRRRLRRQPRRSRKTNPKKLKKGIDHRGHRAQREHREEKENVVAPLFSHFFSVPSVCSVPSVLNPNVPEQTMSKTTFPLLFLLISATVLAVSTSNWTQTSEEDFKKGTLDNVVATNLGDLKLSRAVKTLLEQDPKISAVNAMAEGTDGAVYAGTGPRGILLRAKGETVEKVAVIDDATNIFSLTFD